MELSQLKYINMRSEFIENLLIIMESKRCLDDYRFDCAIHFILDDASLRDNPSSWIGLFLLNEDEVELVSSLVKSIDQLFDAHGTELSVKDYVVLPEWDDVVRKATKLCSHLQQGRGAIDG